jgi:hypothetical protein
LVSKLQIIAAQNLTVQYWSTYTPEGVPSYQSTARHNPKTRFDIIIVYGSRFISDWFIMSSVLLMVPFFVSLNNQIHYTAEW